MKYARGKSAIISIKDKVQLNNVPAVAEKFFAAEVKADTIGITAK